MITILGILSLAIGAALDVLNVVWGYQSAKKSASRAEFKSGVIFIPVFFYTLGIVLLSYANISWDTAAWVLLAMVFHVLCYQVLPWIFDKKRH